MSLLHFGIYDTVLISRLYSRQKNVQKITRLKFVTLEYLVKFSKQDRIVENKVVLVTLLIT